MAMGLGMQHLGHGPIIVYSHDDFGLTLTYFMARSNLALFTFVWKKSENTAFFRNYHRLCYEATMTKGICWHPNSAFPLLLTSASTPHPPPGSTVNIFKHHLLWSHWVDWSQIAYGASMDQGNKRLGHMTGLARQAHKWCKPFKFVLYSGGYRTGYSALGTWAHHSLWPWVYLYLFYGKVKFGLLCFCMGKSVNRFFKN